MTPPLARAMFAAMSDASPQRTPRPMNVQADPATAQGVYANAMMVTHRPEEFVLDFLFTPPQTPDSEEKTALLRSRVIAAPAHMKRILRALEDNIRRYEARFGPIPEATGGQAPTLQ